MLIKLSLSFSPSLTPSSLPPSLPPSLPLSLSPPLFQVFLRSGVLPSLDQKMEAHTHDTMVLFQARCRGYLGRKQFRQLELLDSAAYVIQSNMEVWMEIRDWSWWQLYTKVGCVGVWVCGRGGRWLHQAQILPLL